MFCKVDHPKLMDCFVVSMSVRFLCSKPTVLASLITSSTNGYDGSMMNGLQSLTQWENDFNHPTGSMLGLLNAIQVRN